MLEAHLLVSGDTEDVGVGVARQVDRQCRHEQDTS